MPCNTHTCRDGAARRHFKHLGLATGVSAVAIVAAATFSPVPAQAQKIEFWTQHYGDLIAWREVIAGLVEDFEAESGIEVQHEIVNWSQAFNTWLTVAQGGAAPDCADMFWLHSFSGIGGEEFGPRPITEFRDRWPNLEDEFFTGSLQDVNWEGEFYGIPWRVDIRPILYRTDLFAEAGLAAPDTWEDLVTASKALTKRDGNGNVERWGYSFGPGNAGQALVPYYWQAGGDFMTEDGSTATIDNEAMRTALSWMRDMVHEHKVVTPEFMEKGHEPFDEFVAGTVAMIGSVPVAWPARIAREFPELEGKWALAIAPQGPEDRDTYSGAGYFGVLRGSENVEACVQWLEFLSRDDSMQRLSEGTGNVNPKRAVMATDFWGDTEWKQTLTATLENGRTSQHPSPVWNALIAPQPGAVIYDMMYSGIVEQEDLEELLPAAEKNMQAEMDRAN